MSNQGHGLLSHFYVGFVCFVLKLGPDIRLAFTGPLVLWYSKTGVYRGILYFLIFALKHTCRLCVLVSTASIYVLNKNMKKINYFQLIFFYFTAIKCAAYCIGVLL